MRKKSVADGSGDGVELGADAFSGVGRGKRGQLPISHSLDGPGETSAAVAQREKSKCSHGENLVSSGSCGDTRLSADAVGSQLPATASLRSDEEVNFHLLWAETVRQVDSFAARVAENRDVIQGLDFARYVINSRLVRLFEAHACGGQLKVDGALLRWKAQELQRACQERFRLNDSKPHVEALQLQCIHEKLDTMAGYLSKLVGGNGAVVAPSRELRVIDGGLKEEAGR